MQNKQKQIMKSVSIFHLLLVVDVTRILGGKDGLPDEWDKTAEMLRKTAETVLGVTFGKRKGDRETWWWNEKLQKSIKEKKEAKKAWDTIRDENTKTYTKKEE